MKTEGKIKKGDEVKLIKFEESSYERRNWLELELRIVKVGDIFKVKRVNNGWLELVGLRLGHPIDKFEKINIHPINQPKET